MRTVLLSSVPAAALGLSLLTGCDSVEQGATYSEVAGTMEDEETIQGPQVLAAEERLADVPGDAPPIGDGEPGGAEEPAEPMIELAAAGDDGFDGGFDGGFAQPNTADDEEEDDGFAGGFAAAEEPTVAGPPPGSPAALAAMAEAAAGEPVEARELKLLVPINSFSPAGNGTVRVSFDDLDLLKVLNAEPVPADVVDHFPGWLRDLDGKKVTLRGFMYPTYADPVRAFILARDNQICCFGRNPKPYDLVTVKLAEGAESRYIQNRPFDVVGTFRLDPQRDGEDWRRLYRIDGARVVE
ncbi:hypothetical protein [Alienimonas californiensis]|uniref:DUF3299 domain-containing protein n=1 Tax=Alienimonas californiensis TaxID=2527989 RepID=A0A517PCA0_9PLAN|nr:hypothetical protein [Alienimonas californiensis]QDT17004.1 hypothetical protein CA12_31140 [Alienimonas californiensis]